MGKETVRTKWRVISILLLAEGILSLAVILAPSQLTPVLVTQQDPECAQGEYCLSYLSTSWMETSPIKQNLIDVAGILFLVLIAAVVAATWRKPLREELGLAGPDSGGRKD